MLEVNFSPFPVLTTDRLVLRKTTMNDVEAVFFLRSEPELQKYIDRDPAQSVDEAKAFIQLITDNLDNNVGVSWAITLKDEDAMIGSIAIWRIDKGNYRAEIGYVLHPAYQGKGLMHEAMQTIIDYGFREMKLHSLEANINPDNLASQKVLERAGFVKEAYFRENYYYNGKFIDSAIYSLLTPYK
jgi:ribosomal-protein-alanine N-acetyltransferase